MLKLITMSVVGWALLSGGISSAQVTNVTATAIDVYDGFEAAGLSKVWSTDRFEPGAVEMQTNIFRAGHGAAKITVRPRDKFEAGIKGIPHAIEYYEFALQKNPETHVKRRLNSLKKKPVSKQTV
jgi:hypothetical protein